MSRFWENLKALVVPDPTLPLQKQFFQGLCLIGGVLTLIVVVPVNHLQHLSPWVNGVVLPFGLELLALAWFARRGRYFKVTAFLSILVGLDLVWFPNGGSQGSIGLYFFTAALFLVVFFKGAIRVGAFVLLIANITCLYFAERAWPHLVHPFEGMDRFLDVLTGYLVSMFTCAMMVWVVLEGFNREKARLEQTFRSLQASEEKFSKVFEENPDAMLMLDPSTWTVQEANAGFQRMFGLPRKDLLGRSLQDPGIWPDPSSCGKVQALAASGQEIHGLETTFLRADGTPMWGEVFLVPIQFGDSRRHLMTIRDATERHRSAAALAESERMYRELLERQGEGFAVVDEAETCLYANPLAEQIFGVPAGGLLGRSLLEFLGPEEQERVREETLLRAKDQKSTYEIRIRRPDGETRSVLLTATPGRLSPEEPLNIIGVFRDITEEKRAAETRHLLDQEKHQTQKMDSLGSLAGGVAHDFNNMLGGILGYADLLLSEERDPKRQEHLRAILKAASRSAELTQKLLAFGRRGKNLAESLDLQAMVQECLAMLRPTMSPDLQVDMDLAGCPPVDGDPSQIHQVLVNLCINALEAMPERGTLTLAAVLREFPEDLAQAVPLPPGKYVELSVSDTGVGMGEDIRQRIFEPFFTTKHSSGMAGTGLGLSTAYGIIQAHRGAITVDSVRGRGSTFRVFLPVGVLPSTVREVPGGSTPGQGVVLLVEDEPLLRELGTSVLESLGYEVVAAKDGVDAVAAYREHHLSLCAVLLDLKMPRMAGREAFLEIQAIDPGVPVIICTGFGENEEVQELLTRGAVGMLAKPYRIADLADKLKRVTAG